MSPPTKEITGQHIKILKFLFAGGKLVPFVGSGASIGAPVLNKEGLSLPSGSDLAYQIAARYGFREGEVNPRNLFDVASAVSLSAPRWVVEEQLKEVFAVPAEPKVFHRWLAKQPSMRLIVTTNYDSLIEDALLQADRKFHVVMTAPAEYRERNIFLWWPPSASEPRRERGSHLRLEPADLLVVFKLHGGVDPTSGWQQSVTTEEDYFDVACKVCDGSFLPRVIAKDFYHSSRLFAGYSLRDVHVRRLLYQLRGDRNRKDYVVNKVIAGLDAARFRGSNFETFEMSADEFAQALDSSTG